MIITKSVKIKIVPLNINFYRNLGHDVINGDEINIEVDMLPLNSRKRIEVQCDNCGNIKELCYNDYMTVFNKKNKYFCSKCRVESIKTGVKNKYGVENVFQLNSVKNKIKSTCIKKYGVEHHLQNKDILEKQKITNKQLYGVNFIVEIKDLQQNFLNFIDKANKKHNFYYDYSLVEYKNSLTKIKIICPIHGVYEQMPSHHLKGSGCKKCGMERTKISTISNKNDFIKKSLIIHGNKYDYSNVNYINSYTKIEIICQKHGSFFQKPQDHINAKSGCPKCNFSKGEMLIYNLLESLNIIFEHQKIFSELKYKNNLLFDFYLPTLNTCIEFDGEQHFKPIDYWGGENNFIEVKKRDSLKNEYCKNNNIYLLRFNYTNTDSFIKNMLLRFLKLKNYELTII